MSGFVEAEHVPRPEAVTDDMTIGVTRDGGALVEHALLDVNRLRRALIEFDEQVGADDVSLSLIRHGKDGEEYTNLALVDPDGDLAIVVCGKIREDGDS